MSRPTPAQAAFWPLLRQVDPSAPERWAPGKYRCPLCGREKGGGLKVGYDDREHEVTIHCFGGCDRNELRKALRVRQWSDLRDYAAPRQGTPAGEFVYTDELGAPLFRVCRWRNPAGQRYQHRDEHGDWTWSGKGAPKRPAVLYRAPEVVEAIAAEETVYFAASEADADAIREHGGTATAIPDAPHRGGFRTEYAEGLRGAYVVVVAHKYEAGRERARMVAAALSGRAADAHVVEPAVVKAHATAADHLAAGFVLDEFTPLAAGDAGSRQDAVSLPEVAREEGAAILEDVEATYRRFVVFPGDHEPVALALWTAHTWAVRVADTTPYIQVKAPEQECGKSRVGEVAACLAAHPWAQVDATEAALYRKLAGDPAPTVILDEIDVFGDDGDDRRSALRAVLNAGYRRGLSVPRVEQRQSGFEVVEYPVFGAKMLIGIGKLPATLQSRVVPIRLQRKAKHEHVDRFSIIRTPATLAPLRDRLHAWAELIGPELQTVPELPPALSDRQQDVWEPLLCLSDAAGGDWPKRARAAAVALHERDPAADPAIGPLLLGHVREAFAAARVEELPTGTLLRALVDRDGTPWAEWWGEKVDSGETKGPGAKLAKLLRPYGIRPDQIWVDGKKARGYALAWFADAFARYLPSSSPPPTDSEDGRPVGRRSEALSDLREDEPDSGSDQASTDLPSLRTVEGTPEMFTRDTRARCPRCEVVAYFDPASEYGARRLAEGCRECGGAWELTP
jgi:Protein of unknown function (DUF3631)